MRVCNLQGTSMALTDSSIKALKPQADRYSKADSGGLVIDVLPSGRKVWRLGYSFKGKRRQATLGDYPAMKLAEARLAREQMKAQARGGVDPKARAQEPEVAEAEPQVTWADLCEAFLRKIEDERLSPRTVRAVRGQLRKTWPTMGNKNPDDIQPKDLLAVCREEEANGHFENALRIRAASSRVCRYAIASGEMERDFGTDLRGALVKQKAKPRPAVTEPKEVGALLRAVWAYPGEFSTLCGLKLTAMTWLRSMELRLGRWPEISWDEAMWVVPEERMKMKRKHMVPLSRQAVEVLRELYSYTAHRGELMFPNAGKSGRRMSENTLLNAMSVLGFKGKHVPHGFRRTASTNLNEQGWDERWIEKQLAHEDSNKVRKAYNAAEYLDGRRKMMQHYSDWLDAVRRSKL